MLTKYNIVERKLTQTDDEKHRCMSLPTRRWKSSVRW